MLNLIGVHECKMDAKGRISLPAALKKQLAPEMHDAFVLKRSVFNSCLELYPMQEWNTVMNKVNTLNRFVKKHNDFIRLFTAGVKLVELDGASRVGISPDLKAFANLSSQIVLSAHSGIIEIWDKDAYENAVNVDSDDFGLLAEEVMGGKIQVRMSYHDPVLLTECLEGLRIDPTGSYVDVTFGGGGHSKAILDQLTTGTLYAFDQDPDAKNNLPDHPNLVFIAANFRYIKNHLRLHGAKKVDGILADLGVSSHQFDEGSRGFSIRFDGPLDMRMNPAIGISVEEVLTTYEEQELYDLFRKHTDLKSLKPLVHALLLARVQAPLKTTAELRELCEPLAPRGGWHKYIAQVFQGLRMEVNKELEVLEDLLNGCIDVLTPGGRLVVMSYHSLEDRMVKNFIKEGKATGQTESDFFGVKRLPFKAITRKPVVATAEENAKNPRATSAKLRIAERSEHEWNRDE